MSLLHWLAQADALNQLVAVVLCAHVGAELGVDYLQDMAVVCRQSRFAAVSSCVVRKPKIGSRLTAPLGAPLDSQKLFVGLLRSPLEANSARHWLPRPPMKTDSVAACVNVLQSIRRRLQFGQDMVGHHGSDCAFYRLVGHRLGHLPRPDQLGPSRPIHLGQSSPACGRVFGHDRGGFGQWPYPRSWPTTYWDGAWRLWTWQH